MTAGNLVKINPNKEQWAFGEGWLVGTGAATLQQLASSIVIPTN